MQYLVARINEAQEEKAYRNYVSDTLYYMGRQQMLNVRYHDVITPGCIDNRSGDEVLIDVVTRLNLKVTE